LTEENDEIWTFYHIINTQFVYDFHALPLVFEIYNIQCTRNEAQIMLEKLIMIHDIATKAQRHKE